MEGYVLHINSYLKDRTFYKGMFEALIKQGINIRVFAPVPYGNRGKADEVGEYVDVCECYHPYERFLFFSKQNNCVNQAEKIYDFSKIKILHAHSMCTNGYVAYKLSLKYKIPFIITVRNGDLNNIYKKLIYLRPVFNKIIKAASKVIFLSASYRDDVINNCVPDNMRADLKSKSEVIPNGIDNYWLENLYSRVKTIHDPLKIIYAGEINQNKNLGKLVETIHKLNSEWKSVELEVIGELKDSSLKPLLHKKNVNYSPKVEKEELLQKYRDNDIFVMVSKKEAFGLVYAEAMTQGLPIVYTEGQGFDKQFEEGYVGFHANCMDIKDIQRAIISIANNYCFFSDNAKVAAQKFSWDMIVLRYINIYKTLVS